MVKTPLVLFMIILGADLAASSKYISDTLYVPLRTGKTNGHRVIKVLKSGTPVKIIESDAEAGMAKVESGNVEGWLKSRYLVDEKIAKDQLKIAKERLNQLSSEMQPLKSEIASLKKKITGYREEVIQLKRQNTTLVAEIKEIKTVSADTIGTHERNGKLVSERKKLQDQLTELTRKNVVLKDNSQNEGIKLGIGAIVVGITFGLFLPYLKPRKKTAFSGMKLR